MYFPPSHSITNTPKSFQTWPKTRQIIHWCNSAAFNHPLSGKKSSESRGVASFGDRSVFQAFHFPPVWSSFTIKGFQTRHKSMNCVFNKTNNNHLIMICMRFLLNLLHPSAIWMSAIKVEYAVVPPVRAAETADEIFNAATTRLAAAPRLRARKLLKAAWKGIVLAVSVLNKNFIHECIYP